MPFSKKPLRVYDLLLERSVERTLKRLSQPTSTRIVESIKGLSRNPRPSNCKKLVGGEQDWRLRVGDYRVLYEIDDAKKIVRVLHVRHRREAYR